MINTDMRVYDFFTLGLEDEYGQRSMPSEDAVPSGTVKMAINLTNQLIQDNINYQNANYVGLTHANVDDTYIIQYGEERLKVLYVNPKGRLKQVYMATV